MKASRALEIEITNTTMGGSFTAPALVGADRLPVHLIVDTGSSSLVVEGGRYARTTDADRQPTNLAQAVSYGAGWWAGPVIKTRVGFHDGDVVVELRDVSLAVTLQESEHGFGGADGIFGLAYRALDTAYDLGGSTWPTFDVSRLESAGRGEVEPYFTQLEESGRVANVFSLYTRRSKTRRAGDPEKDPLNRGLLILGGGEERTDLYTGAMQDVRITHDLYYNTNLKGLRVGDQPLIQVAPADSPSNSFLDSGLDAILLPDALDTQVLGQFQAINPVFGDAIEKARTNGSARLGDLSRWPDITLILEGFSGDAVLTIPPTTYWQEEATDDGGAVYIIQTDARLEESILGLPLMNNYLCIFDRSANSAQGRVRFAPGS